MINYTETSLRWLEQAKDDLSIANKLFQQKDFSYTLNYEMAFGLFLGAISSVPKKKF